MKDEAEQKAYINELDRLRSENSRLKAERDALQNRQFGDALQAVHDCEDQLEAAETAAFVRGLERARGILIDWKYDPHIALAAIDAEIDKAKAGK